MKKSMVLTALFILIALLVGCNVSEEKSYTVSGSDTCFTGAISIGCPEYEFKVTAVGKQKNMTENVYLIKVIEAGTEQGEQARTVQMFTVTSRLEYRKGMMTLQDLNFDGCNDLVVHEYQTARSAGWYHAYRWLESEDQFETEPFIEYLASSIELYEHERQLVAAEASAMDTIYHLYQLSDEGDEYTELRTKYVSNYGPDVIKYTVSELQGGEWVGLYETQCPFDKELSETENDKLYSYFHYGELYSAADMSREPADYIDMTHIEYEDLPKEYQAAVNEYRLTIELFDHILNNYPDEICYELLHGGEVIDVSDYMFFDLSYQAWQRQPEQFGYGVYDINGDGIPELLLMTRNDELKQVWDIYSISSGEAKHLIGFAARAYCTRIDEDGTIYKSGSSGAAYNIAYKYTINDGGDTLAYEYVRMDGNNYFYCSAQDYDPSVSVTEDEVNALEVPLGEDGAEMYEEFNKDIDDDNAPFIEFIPLF